jgi:hypothetical protein
MRLLCLALCAAMLLFTASPAVAAASAEGRRTFPASASASATAIDFVRTIYRDSVYGWHVVLGHRYGRVASDRWFAHRRSSSTWSVGVRISSGGRVRSRGEWLVDLPFDRWIEEGRPVTLDDVDRHLHPRDARTRMLMKLPRSRPRKGRPLLVAAATMKLSSAGLEVALTPSFAVRTTLLRQPPADELALLRGFTWETDYNTASRIVTFPLARGVTIRNRRGTAMTRSALAQLLATTPFAALLVGWRSAPRDLDSLLARPLETVRFFGRPA